MTEIATDRDFVLCRFSGKQRRGTMIRIALATGLSMLAGCATIVEGSDQTVTVVSDPAGASCKLERGGIILGYVNPTPGSIQLEKSKDDVSVICTKPGYDNGASALQSSFEGMTIGNAVFGGLIGVAVDAGSGAMNKYPTNVVVKLPSRTPQMLGGEVAPSDAATSSRKAAPCATADAGCEPGTN